MPLDLRQAASNMIDAGATDDEIKTVLGAIRGQASALMDQGLSDDDIQQRLSSTTWNKTAIFGPPAAIESARNDFSAGLDALGLPRREAPQQKPLPQIDTKVPAGQQGAQIGALNRAAPQAPKTRSVLDTAIEIPFAAGRGAMNAIPGAIRYAKETGKLATVQPENPSRLRAPNMSAIKDVVDGLIASGSAGSFTGLADVANVAKNSFIPPFLRGSTQRAHLDAPTSEAQAARRRFGELLGGAGVGRAVAKFVPDFTKTWRPAAIGATVGAVPGIAKGDPIEAAEGAGGGATLAVTGQAGLKAAQGGAYLAGKAAAHGSNAARSVGVPVPPIEGRGSTFQRGYQSTQDKRRIKSLGAEGVGGNTDDVLAGITKQMARPKAEGVLSDTAPKIPEAGLTAQRAYHGVRNAVKERVNALNEAADRITPRDVVREVDSVAMLKDIAGDVVEPLRTPVEKKLVNVGKAMSPKDPAGAKTWDDVLASAMSEKFKGTTRDKIRINVASMSPETQAAFKEAAGLTAAETGGAALSLDQLYGLRRRINAVKPRSGADMEVLKSVKAVIDADVEKFRGEIPRAVEAWKASDRYFENEYAPYFKAGGRLRSAIGEPEGRRVDPLTAVEGAGSDRLAQFSKAGSTVIDDLLALPIEDIRRFSHAMTRPVPGSALPSGAAPRTAQAAQDSLASAVTQRLFDYAKHPDTGKFSPVDFRRLIRAGGPERAEKISALIGKERWGNLTQFAQELEKANLSRYAGDNRYAFRSGQGETPKAVEFAAVYHGTVGAMQAAVGNPMGYYHVGIAGTTIFAAPFVNQIMGTRAGRKLLAAGLLEPAGTPRARMIQQRLERIADRNAEVTGRERERNFMGPPKPSSPSGGGGAPPSDSVLAARSAFNVKPNERIEGDLLKRRLTAEQARGQRLAAEEQARQAALGAQSAEAFSPGTPSPTRRDRRRQDIEAAFSDLDNVAKSPRGAEALRSRLAREQASSALRTAPIDMQTLSSIRSMSPAELQNWISQTVRPSRFPAAPSRRSSEVKASRGEMPIIPKPELPPSPMAQSVERLRAAQAEGKAPPPEVRGLPSVVRGVEAKVVPEKLRSPWAAIRQAEEIRKFSEAMQEPNPLAPRHGTMSEAERAAWYPKDAAELAGLKRGDVAVDVNNPKIRGRFVGRDLEGPSVRYKIQLANGKTVVVDDVRAPGRPPAAPTMPPGFEFSGSAKAPSGQVVLREPAPTRTELPLRSAPRGRESQADTNIFAAMDQLGIKIDPVYLPTETRTRFRSSLLKKGALTPDKAAEQLHEAHFLSEPKDSALFAAADAQSLRNANRGKSLNITADMVDMIDSFKEMPATAQTLADIQVILQTNPRLPKTVQQAAFERIGEIRETLRRGSK